MQVWEKCVMIQACEYTTCGLKKTVGIVKRKLLISMQYGTKHFKRMDNILPVSHSI